MPFILKKNRRDLYTLGVWDNLEDPDFFIEKMPLSENEQLVLGEMNHKRKKEWLSSRYLVHELSTRTERAVLQKDEYGKPHIEDTEWHISMSHSDNLTAAIGAIQCCGIDVQKWTKNIARIAHKFITQPELDAFPEAERSEYMHVFWGAKEAMYKAYGKKSLAFKTHIFIDPFEYKAEGFQCTGRVIKEEIEMHFDIYGQQIQDNLLIYVIEK